MGGKKMKAHRAAYLFAHGEIPDGRIICHTCDNPLCCNPNHLYAGDFESNMRDKVVRGRGNHQRGSAHYATHLTEDDVREIRKLRAEGYMLKEIAPIYGMTSKSLHHITSGKTWKHVA